MPRLFEPAPAPDTAAAIDTAIDMVVNAEQAGSDRAINTVVFDTGYHPTAVVMLAADLGMRASIPERASPQPRHWKDEDPEATHAVHAPRRRTQGGRGKDLSGLRCAPTERSFARVCDTGGARHPWLRRLASKTKRHVAIVAARNLSTIMWVLCGIGNPRSPQGLRALLQTASMYLERLLSALNGMVTPLSSPRTKSLHGL